MSKKVITLILILTLSVLVKAVPPIYPVTVEMKVNHGRGQGKFTIFNTGDEKKRYKISINKMDNLGGESLLSDYLKVFPKHIEIEPGKKQVVRVLIKDFPIEEVTEGEYRASIAIDEINSELEKRYKRRDESKGMSTVINFRYKINMAVYGYVGKLVSKIDIESRNGDEEFILFTIVNKGNYSYPLKYELLDKSGKVLKKGNLPKIMWNERKEVKISALEGATTLKVIEGNKGSLLYKEALSSLR